MDRSAERQRIRVCDRRASERSGSVSAMVCAAVLQTSAWLENGEERDGGHGSVA
jgi:hypothetical protein